MLTELKNLKSFTILYVEDDKETAEIICDILKSTFKEVYYAPNGEKGLAVYKEKLPDMVLSDIQMPIMNGIEMSREIKKINFYQQIALFTAFNEIDYLKQSVSIGISKYILKPLDEEQFFDALLCMSRVLQFDIDKKRIEHLLEVQNKVASIGEMLGNIAHQWRQPLSVITTHASGLKASLQFGQEIDNEQIYECVDNVVNQANYLSKTIDDFREFFISDSSKKKNHNMKDVFLKLQTLIQSAFDNASIKIETFIDEDIVVYINENMLIQAMINILNNSRDAVLKNVHNEDNRYLIVEIKSVENDAVIMFKDTGGGIEENVIDKVFEPYFTTKHQSVGTGIGLYMTHQIITKHLKGTIEASNTTYVHDEKSLKGALFTITIPKVEECIKKVGC